MFLGPLTVPGGADPPLSPLPWRCPLDSVPWPGLGSIIWIYLAFLLASSWIYSSAGREPNCPRQLHPSPSYGFASPIPKSSGMWSFPLFFPDFFPNFCAQDPAGFGCSGVSCPWGGWEAQQGVLRDGKSWGDRDRQKNYNPCSLGKDREKFSFPIENQNLRKPVRDFFFGFSNIPRNSSKIPGFSLSPCGFPNPFDS